MSRIANWSQFARFTGVCLILAATEGRFVGAQGLAPPRFSARVEVARTRERSVEIEADIAGAKQLYLVAIGAQWGWANWAEPRLVGPAGELRLTELRWKYASVGYGQARVNANVRGDPQRINGAPVAYGIGVHDPSLLIYDLPPGYTHFRARGGLDDGGAGPVTLQVYADSPFFDPACDRLWQRDPRRPWPQEPPAYVEFLGGDRLPGRVVGAATTDAPATSSAPALLVKPLIDVNPPNQNDRDTLRVFQHLVQRIVWEPSQDGLLCQPGAARLRDGSRLRFRSVRFDPAAIKLLTSDGVLEVGWLDLAEIHLAERDAWDAYREELAVLSPGLTAPLIALETDGGMRATVSLARSLPLPPWHHDADPPIWHLGIQPTWSPEVLWLSETSLVARRQFMPHHVPLSCRNVLLGSRPVQDAPVDLGWFPQTNRNVLGMALNAGERSYDWGFGVLAPDRLMLTLPGAADAFRTAVGLDRLAGRGGCARARVLLDTGTPQTLWESPVMIGSSRVLDTGRLAIPAAGAGTRRLVLQADAAHDGRPAQADPFSIRDLVNWLDPVLELNFDQLRSESDRCWDRGTPALQGWQVAIGDGSLPRLVHCWSGDLSGPPRCHAAIGTSGQSLTISRRVPTGVDRRLRIVAMQLAGDETIGTEIEVLADGQSIGRSTLPSRRGPTGQSAEILVPLPPSEQETILVEIVQRPSIPEALIDWQLLDITDPK